KLENAARNCKLTRLDIAIFFSTERSTSARPGPVYTPRPRFPNVPKAGRENAFGLNHWLGFPVTTGPVKAGFRFGRSGFLVSPSPEIFAPICGVNGKPLNSVVISFNCQPLIILLAVLPALPIQRWPLPRGKS